MNEIYVITYHSACYWDCSDDGRDESHDEVLEAYKSLDDAVLALANIYTEKLKDENVKEINFKDDGIKSYVDTELKEPEWADEEQEYWSIVKIELK